ncbi:YagK/YfjJ domain-containing protein [Maridesulfovibrio bastinii]|uniref:YagK/YfjJ domain-containing protein n=1 Tax=Maridesulfovibrio bastinii TaxID=47157 RepID=UPI000400690A|nr:inovirus-type Gp2 protein [Maridesulfovibrio bastinii]
MTYYNNDYISEIKDTIERVVIHSSTSRSKNLIIRLDFTYPEGINYPDDNNAFTKFLNSFIKNCTRKGLTPYYVWVREQSMNSIAGKHHFHLVLFLDGNIIQNPHKIYQKATELWGMTVGHSAAGLVHLCSHHLETQYINTAIQIRRNSPDFEQTLNEANKWIQYLSKSYSKEGYPHKVKRYGASQVPAIQQNAALTGPTITTGMCF